MTRSFDRVCQCCGTPFTAFNVTAKWCSSRCTVRAYQRRRRGAPEADRGVSLVPAVLQTRILAPADELPEAWREPIQPPTLAPFAYEGQQLRVITDDQGVTWFAAVDVCAVLSLGNHHQALTRLDDDEKSTTSIPTPGGTQSLTTVNEPGLYSLILGSRKPEARAFKRWVTHEVLPAIRRTGSYSTAATPSLPTRTTPLIGPRPTVSELASQLHEEASETLESIQFELELLGDSAPPLVEAIAKEFHATAHRLYALGVALHAVA